MSVGGIAKRLAGDKNRIDEFGWMLRSKFVDDNDLQWILNGIRDDAVLTAYALDAIKERKTEDSISKYPAACGSRFSFPRNTAY